jgi:carotenoid cleavage dioxygenase-like enzyme
MDNPYLAGSYAPVDREVTEDCLEIIGEVPRDLTGIYVRNGPNPRFAPKGRHHWFDGDGMLHAVSVSGGKVTYRNRWVHTAAFDREAEAGEPLWSGIMEPLGGNPKQAPIKDTANTDVIFHASHLKALWYVSGAPYKVDARTLATLGADDFGGQKRCTTTAHAKVDEATGELMFFDYGLRAPFMSYGVVGADGVLKHKAPIDLPGPRLPHDMAITSKHSILMDLPVHFDAAAMQTGRWRTVFHADLPARFGVLPRSGQSTDVRWFEAEPCYVYHSINAWEDGDEVVMVGCRVMNPIPPPDPTDGPLAAMMANLRMNARLHEWRFNLKTGATRETPLDDRNTEFPSMNAALQGRQSRYSYNVSIAPERTLLFDGLVKYDLKTGATQSHTFGPGRYGSEAPFAARLNARDEDDGYLLSFVHDERTGRSELAILDAKNVDRGPVARVLLPQRVPHGFHACWVPAERLA